MELFSSSELSNMFASIDIQPQSGTYLLMVWYKAAMEIEAGLHTKKHEYNMSLKGRKQHFILFSY